MWSGCEWMNEEGLFSSLSSRSVCLEEPKNRINVSVVKSCLSLSLSITHARSHTHTVTLFLSTPPTPPFHVAGTVGNLWSATFSPSTPLTFLSLSSIVTSLACSKIREREREREVEAAVVAFQNEWREEGRAKEPLIPRALHQPVLSLSLSFLLSLSLSLSCSRSRSLTISFSLSLSHMFQSSNRSFIEKSLQCCYLPIFFGKKLWFQFFFVSIGCARVLALTRTHAHSHALFAAHTCVASSHYSVTLRWSLTL